eukprot:GHVH01005155.1.p1 GENE.GHVH01005155.1~~GHVH01005155.1.p1  ORF type:complete len:153 (+),score=29.86 GHVH01005155.1:45-503(+)
MEKTATENIQRIQTFGRKKNAVAVAACQSKNGKGKGIIKVNGVPLELIQPAELAVKAFEPILILGESHFSKVDIRIRVKGGGPVSQVYAIRQAIARSIVSYAQKYVDESTKQELRDALMAHDRSLLISDPRRREPKKFGGRGARARFQKSYR